MYIKTGNTLSGRECLAAELHDKANSRNPNEFVPNKVFSLVMIARQLENYESGCLSYKGHCKRKKKQLIKQSPYAVKSSRLKTWNVSIIESVNFIDYRFPRSRLKPSKVFFFFSDFVVTLLRQSCNH